MSYLFLTMDTGFKAEGVEVITSIPSEFLNLAPDTFIWSDTETTGLEPLDYKMLLLIMRVNDKTLIVDCRTTDFHKQLVESNQHCNWVFHNAQFDVGFIKCGTDILLRNVHCTYERDRLICNADTDDWGDYSLANLVYKYCGFKLNKSARNSFINKPDLEPFSPEEIIYAGEDVAYLSTIYIEQEWQHDNQLDYLIYIERKFIPIAVDMELRGFRFDVKKWRENIKFNTAALEKYKLLLQNELRKLNQTYPVLKQRYKAYLPKNMNKNDMKNQLTMFDELDEEAVLRQINFNSDAHIHKILNACGVKVPDTNANTLKEYRVKNLDTPVFNFIQLLVGDEEKSTPSYKFYDKQISTYGESFIKQHVRTRNGNHYVHTHFGLIDTKTGRLSSNNPNLQNIPAIKQFRVPFIAEEGCEIYTVDFSGCELAICAYQSECPTVTASINEGADLHSIMATISYRIINNDPTFVVSKTQHKELRNKHKPVLFGLLYGAGASRIALVLGISMPIAKRILAALQQELPVLFSYLDSSGKFATRNRYIVANQITKRMLMFKDESKEDYKIEKEAKNYPMQATNADLIKEAICTCDAYIRKMNYDCQILLTVHDEIVFQAPVGQRHIATELVEVMEKVATKYVPGVNLKCSLEIENSWIK